MALTTQHLQGIVNLIEVATNRGAWRANELGQISAVFEAITNEIKETETPLPAQTEAVEGEVLR
jgi:hypothetical protein